MSDVRFEVDSEGFVGPLMYPGVIPGGACNPFATYNCRLPEGGYEKLGGFYSRDPNCGVEQEEEFHRTCQQLADNGNEFYTLDCEGILCIAIKIA